MSSYPLSEQNFKYIQKINYIHFKFMNNFYGEDTLCMQISSRNTLCTFATAPLLTEWFIIPCYITTIQKIYSIMELFFMKKSSIRRNINLTRGCTTYSMNRSFTENIFYVMIFKLAEKDIDKVKTDLVDLQNKYKLLIEIKCLLPELCREISSYWIYFIFFDK
jgi:hypothetical protein